MVLINAVKDVAKALANLISTTKAAAGKPYDDPSMLQLKSSAKVPPQGAAAGPAPPAPPAAALTALLLLLQVMVTNVTSLLKTVKAVEDEATKGTRALEATIEHIKQELTVGPEELRSPGGSSPSAAPCRSSTARTPRRGPPRPRSSSA